jgi:hypothetical protein
MMRKRSGRISERYRTGFVTDLSHKPLSVKSRPAGAPSPSPAGQATQTPGTATFWKRCGEATAEDG